MRPAKQVKVILPQLEILDELKTQLESILDYTNHVIQKGKSWIEEKNNETFLEINKFLIEEIVQCCIKCQDISQEINKECHQKEQDKKETKTKGVDTLKASNTHGVESKEANNYKQLFDKYQEMEKTISLQTKRIKKIEQTFQEHKNEIKDSKFKVREESENQSKIKFDEIVKEFDKASNFMSHLQTKNEDLIYQVKEHDKQMSSFMETLHSLQEQLKEHENKSEMFMKQRKSTDDNLSFRMDEVTEKQKASENSFISRLDYVIEKQKSTENSFSFRLDDVIAKQKSSENSFSLRLDDVIENQKSTENSFSLRLDEVTEKQKSSENSFSLRLDDVMKTISENAETIIKLKSETETLFNVVYDHDKNLNINIPNLQEKLEDLNAKFKTISRAFKETEEINRKNLDDIFNEIQSSDLQYEILSVSCKVENLSKELVMSRQQVCFFAQAYGPLNVQLDLSVGQIVTSFGLARINIGNHYDPTKGIFTAPCDGLYLCSLTLRCEIGENVKLGITKKNTTGAGLGRGSVQTTTVKSSASLVAPLNLNQNDQVYIASVGAYKQIKLDMLSFFMCALISRI